MKIPHALVLASIVLTPACENNVTNPGLEEFTLRVGETVRVGDLGLSIRFQEVTQDSRCPLRVVCFWEGDAAVVVETAFADEDPQAHELHTTLEPKSVLLKDVGIKLVRLAPHPVEANSIPSEDYVLTIAVE